MKHSQMILCVVLVLCALLCVSCGVPAGVGEGQEENSAPAMTTGTEATTTTTTTTTTTETVTTIAMDDPSGGVILQEYNAKLLSGYLPPTAQQLVGTTWRAEERSDTGAAVSYTLSFDEESATIRWNDGIDVEDHVYSDAPWHIEHKNGFAVLMLDSGNLEGVCYFDLLLDEAQHQLFVAVDITDTFRESDYIAYCRTLTQVQ